MSELNTAPVFQDTSLIFSKARSSEDFRKLAEERLTKEISQTDANAYLLFADYMSKVDLEDVNYTVMALSGLWMLHLGGFINMSYFVIPIGIDPAGTKVPASARLLGGVFNTHVAILPEDKVDGKMLDLAPYKKRITYMFMSGDGSMPKTFESIPHLPLHARVVTDIEYQERDEVQQRTTMRLVEGKGFVHLYPVKPLEELHFLCLEPSYHFMVAIPKTIVNEHELYVPHAN
jgi:hypothetical protein